MKIWRTSLSALLLLWAWGARNSPHRLSSEYAGLSASRLSTFGESSIEREIHLGLQKLPYFGVFDHLSYRVDPGMVRLYGWVMHSELTWDAETVVMGIAPRYGIRSHIGFLPNSPDTNRLHAAVFRAIYADPAVFTDTDKRKAAETARSVRGVASVINHLTVDGMTSAVIN